MPGLGPPVHAGPHWQTKTPMQAHAIMSGSARNSCFSLVTLALILSWPFAMGYRLDHALRCCHRRLDSMIYIDLDSFRLIS